MITLQATTLRTALIDYRSELIRLLNNYPVIYADNKKVISELDAALISIEGNISTVNISPATCITNPWATTLTFQSFTKINYLQLLIITCSTIFAGSWCANVPQHTTHYVNVLLLLLKLKTPKTKLFPDELLRSDWYQQDELFHPGFAGPTHTITLS